ncbi:hypothetical protein MCOR25_010991 [Pyricularia grisea]|nr:hypothetical protein MCOR25_010991 [Pyricularia grisea]
MWIRPAKMLATAMRAGALASGSRAVLGANVAASRFVLAARPMATAAAKKSTASTGASAAKKAAPKKKATTAAKPKTTKAKAVKKSVDKPQKSEEAIKAEKLAAKKKDLIAEKKRLLEVALLPEPATEPIRAAQLYIKEAFAEARSNLVVLPKLAQCVAEFKELSPAELQEYEERAAKNEIANKAAYQAWVESHTPAQINEANKARTRLSRVFNVKRVGKSVVAKKIKDDRIPSAPLSAYLIFVQNKMKQAGFSSETNSGKLKASHVMSGVAAEWRSLSDTERKVYEDLSIADKARYEKAMQELNMS